MSINTLQPPSGNVDSPPRPGPLSLQLRKDLVAVRQVSRGKTLWAVKDPVSRQYFHFGDQEWFILDCLRKPVSLAGIRDRFRRRFSPLQIDEEQLKVFLARALQDNLLIQRGRTGLADGLLKLEQQKQRNASRFRWARILYIRFRGIDPHPVLSILRPVGSLLFHPLFLLLAAAVMAMTLAFVMMRFDEVSGRFPDTLALFSPENLLLMAVTIGVIKVIHELAHGLACQRLGGECRELGFLLLAFIPCLYCDVSDTWLEPRKWRRMMVSAAGIYVELLLAVAGFVLWYGSHPGTFNSICLNVVFVCSINTVFINGNPLLRYDGYYLLADLCSVPNLASQARSAVFRKLRNFLFGSVHDSASGSAGQWGLVAWAVASFFYRILVITAILYGVHVVTRTNEVEALGDLAIVVALTGLLLPVIYQIVHVCRSGKPVMRPRLLPTLIMLSILAGLGFLIVAVPLPHRIRVPAVAELRDPVVLFAPRSGRLTWLVHEGDNVQPGQLIARIDNPDLRKQLLLAGTTIREKSIRLANLELRAKDQEEPIAEIPVLQAELQELGKQRSIMQEELASLEVRSSRGGTIFHVPRDRRATEASDSFGQQEGNLLDPVNSGGFVERGQALCQVGDSGELEATLYVEQDWVEAVSTGTPVRFFFDHSADFVVEGIVTATRGESVARVPEMLVVNRLVAVSPQAGDGLVPAGPLFRVRCELAASVPGMLPGSAGMARVTLPAATLLQRAERFINRTFRIDW
jgi:putative peptide zinc metalloprotease protein